MYNFSRQRNLLFGRGTVKHMQVSGSILLDSAFESRSVPLHSSQVTEICQSAWVHAVLGSLKLVHDRFSE